MWCCCCCAYKALFYFQYIHFILVPYQSISFQGYHVTFLWSNMSLFRKVSRRQFINVEFPTLPHSSIPHHQAMVPLFNSWQPHYIIITAYSSLTRFMLLRNGTWYNPGSRPNLTLYFCYVCGVFFSSIVLSWNCQLKKIQLWNLKSKSRRWWYMSPPNYHSYPFFY